MRISIYSCEISNKYTIDTKMSTLKDTKPAAPSSVATITSSPDPVPPTGLLHKVKGVEAV